MTDSKTATELHPRRLLHEQLDAIGADYWCAQQATFWNGDNGSEFIAYQYQTNGVNKLAFKGVNVTTEQAIAATLGSWECEIVDNGPWGYPYTCSACGAQYDPDILNGEWNYCPNCGKAVKR